MITYSSDALTISETLEINSIVWIHSLSYDEMGPTRRILEDLDGLAKNDGLPVFEASVQDRQGLLDVMAIVSQKIQEGQRPILHVDAHGTDADGLLLSPSGEHMGWDELIGHLRHLNVASKNNLVCVFALCFGLHSYKETRLMEPVPAYLFCAPPSEISVGFLEDQTLEFYREVNCTRNVTTAFENTLGKEMHSFHCQGLFLQSLLKYIRNFCTRRQRQDRLERMVTEALERDGILKPTSEQLRAIRSTFRKRLIPGQHIIDHFAPSFLIGKDAAFTYHDIERILTSDFPNSDFRAGP